MNNGIRRSTIVFNLVLNSPTHKKELLIQIIFSAKNVKAKSHILDF